MNRYNLALLLLTLAVGPVFFVSGWLSALAIIAIYCLVARLANRDLDRQSERRRRLYPGALWLREVQEYAKAALPTVLLHQRRVWVSPRARSEMAMTISPTPATPKPIATITKKPVAIVGVAPKSISAI